MTRMRMLTSDGIEDVDVSDFDEASTLGSYWNAVQQFLGTGDVDPLLDFEGIAISGRPLLVDPDAIETLARRGELDFEDIYEG